MPVSRSLVAVFLSCVLALGACSDSSSSSTTSEIQKSEVEQQAMAALTAKTGKPAPAITCPGNLKAEVGASMVCAIVLDGATYDVTVTVTAVADGKAQFDVVVASMPRP